MPFTPFENQFLEVAQRETRTVSVLPQARLGLPVAAYQFNEMYCDEPGCDCRRVFFAVFSSTPFHGTPPRPPAETAEKVGAAAARGRRYNEVPGRGFLPC